MLTMTSSSFGNFNLEMFAAELLELVDGLRLDRADHAEVAGYLLQVRLQQPGQDLPVGRVVEQLPDRSPTQGAGHGDWLLAAHLEC